MPAEHTELALQLRYKLRDYCSGWDSALPLGGDGGGGDQLNRRSGRPLGTSGIDQLGPWWVIPKRIRHLIPATRSMEERFFSLEQGTIPWSCSR